MSIKFQVLGKPGGDNAAFVWINSGKKVTKILLDCGEDLLKEVNRSDIKSIDFLLFSHLHMDHIAGFDYFFRTNFNKNNKPAHIFGPVETSSIIHHRLLGFMWNLFSSDPQYWYVTDIDEHELRTYRFVSTDGFKLKELVEVKQYNGLIMDTKFFTINTALLNHRIPSAAYRITEKDSCNVQKDSLESLSYTPGSWLETVKDLNIPDENAIVIEGISFTLRELRRKLLSLSKGDSFAYLTDFIMDEGSKSKALDLIKHCKDVLCESQYSEADSTLAEQNYHLTTVQAAELAQLAGIERLFLFHISERYGFNKDFNFLVEEARQLFPSAYFPFEWNLSSG